MWAGVLVGLGLLLAFVSRGTMARGISEGETMRDGGKFDSIYKRWEAKTGVPAELLRAVAIVESNERADAVNKSDPSYGLMQILCTVDETGKRTCKNVFNFPDWPPKSRDDLLDPEINVGYGARILQWNIKKYGLRKGVAVYNRWSSRNENEPFTNQSYVDKVWKEFRKLTDSNEVKT